MNENQKEIILIEDLGMMYPTPTSKQKYRYGLFKCFCGKQFKTELRNITKKRTKSCGCLNHLANSIRTHGLSKHRIYNVWKDMMSRCYNKNNSEYKRYGAIGVTVCKEWFDVKNFIDDMYPTFKEGLSIDKDRLCKEKNIYPHIYSKETCVWATKTEQTRTTRKICATNSTGFRGVTYCKSTNKYRSKIQINNKTVNIGRFSTALEAGIAYDKYVIDNKLEHTRNFTSLQ